MGAKLISSEIVKERRIVKMSEMRPCEWGRILESPEPHYKYRLVMRTASIDKFEVMDMTDMRPDGYWDGEPTSTLVELSKNGSKFMFEIVGQ